MVETETALLRILEAKENIPGPLLCVDFLRVRWIIRCVKEIETWGWGAARVRPWVLSQH